MGIFGVGISGGGGGGGGTTVVSRISITQTAHGFDSDDVGKPLAWLDTDVAGIWDDESDTFPMGVLELVVDDDAFYYAPPGRVVSIAESLFDTAFEVAVESGSPTNDRFVYWDLSEAKYVQVLPATSAITQEILYLIQESPSGTVRAQVLGYRPLLAGGGGILVTEQTEDYTFVIGDANSLVEYNSETDGVFTFPAHADVPFPTGTTIAVRWKAGTAGELSVDGDDGVTVEVEGDRFTLKGAKAIASFVKLDDDLWGGEGNLVV